MWVKAASHFQEFTQVLPNTLLKNNWDLQIGIGYLKTMPYFAKSTSSCFVHEPVLLVFKDKKMSRKRAKFQITGFL
jgi:hypothetical protein